MIRRFTSTSSSHSRFAAIAATSRGGGRTSFSSLLENQPKHFSSSPLNPPPGIGADDLLDSVRQSHESASGLRRAQAEVSSRQSRDGGGDAQQQQQQQHQQARYRDGLRMQADTIADAAAGPASKLFGAGGSSPAGSAASTTSPLHFRAPATVLTIGRDQLVLQMWQAFLSGRRVLFLSGPDGVGASTVAAQFAEHARRSGRFTCVQWFGCTRRGPSSGCTAVHAPALEQLKRFVAQMKQRREAEVLLIFDHEAEPVEVLKALHASFAATKKETEAMSRSDSFSPGLSDADLRSHSSRVHVLFTSGPGGQEKMEVLHSVQVPFTGVVVNDAKASAAADALAGGQQGEEGEEEGKEQKKKPILVPLSTELCPALFSIDPVDHIPALLLLERLVTNSLAERGFTLAEELSGECLGAVVEKVAGVPLLVTLAGNLLAEELSAAAVEAGKQKDIDVTEVIVRRLEVVSGEVIDSVLSPARVRAQNDGDSASGVLSVSSAAAALCLATVDTVCASNTQLAAVSRSVMSVLLTMNIGRISRSDIDGVVEQHLQTMVNAEELKQLLAADSSSSSSDADNSVTAKRRVATHVAHVLRSSGFWSDDEVSAGGFGGNNRGALDDALRGGNLEATSQIADETCGRCHVALAEGLSRAKLVAVSDGSSFSRRRLAVSALAKRWPRRMRGGASATALRIAHHVQALFFSAAAAPASTSSGTAASCLLPRDDDSFVPQTLQTELVAASGGQEGALLDAGDVAAFFDRVASFLAHVEGTHLDLSLALWCCSHALHLGAGATEAAAKAAADAGRVMLAAGIGGDSLRRRLLQSGSSAAMKASGSHTLADCVAASFPLWAQLVALRARDMPLDKQTLAELSAAAQVLENVLANVDSAVERSEEENVQMAQEHFVLLVAWARCAEALKVPIPESHWAKMKSLSHKLRGGSHQK